MNYKKNIYMNTFDIRNRFIDFFKSKNHILISSSSLIPEFDKTLLFVNSGMVQFKNVFLGLEKYKYSRVVTIQRCLRAGGKHNDLENVGFTEHHHTFFEMLGNFSFGDYFKYHAIFYAWELLTCVFKLDKEKILVTINECDKETYNIWTKEIGLQERNIIINNKDNNIKTSNFWKMDNFGPCGPCSEIFYEYFPDNNKCLSNLIKINGKYYIEIWNLVFIQYNKEIDGKLTLLNKPCVDTGMGLERIASVLQNVSSNYETDIFLPLIKDIGSDIKIKQSKNSNVIKILADHIRSSTCLIIDGVIPGSEGSGYVLRKIIRRAVRYGYMIGKKNIFFYKLVKIFYKYIFSIYSGNIISYNYISEVIYDEECKFIKNINNGVFILNKKINDLVKCKCNILDYKFIFKLHDTYGFPVDLIYNICKKKNIFIDKSKFNLLMLDQKTKSNKIKNFIKLGNIYINKKCVFYGYKKKKINNSKIISILINNINCSKITNGQSGVIILNNTPFYGESGGQIGDTGVLSNKESYFYVLNTFKLSNDVICHYGILKVGLLRICDIVKAEINFLRRLHVSRNHSATHLLHKAICVIFGNDIKQKGLFVEKKKLRFDFICSKKVLNFDTNSIENIVNKEILDNTKCITDKIINNETNRIKYNFELNEKYNKIVRIVNLGFSRELCCGTHVNYTGDIGFFKIISKKKISNCIYRIEAVTGEYAINYIQFIDNNMIKISNLLNKPKFNLINHIFKMKNDLIILKKKINNLKFDISKYVSINLLKKIEEINGIYLLVSFLKNISKKILFNIVDYMKIKLKRIIILFAYLYKSKMYIMSFVTKNIIKKINAKMIISFILKNYNGNGGGNDMFSQANIDNNCIEFILLNTTKFIKKIIEF